MSSLHNLVYGIGFPLQLSLQLWISFHNVLYTTEIVSIWVFQIYIIAKVNKFYVKYLWFSSRVFFHQT